MVRNRESNDKVKDSFYIIGGQQATARPVQLADDGWYDYQNGLILRVDPWQGVVERCVEYVSPHETRGSSDPVLFKSGTVRGDYLYACTQTEVLVYHVPDFELIAHISLPCFNDVHHVLPTHDDSLLVANSGLEMVLEVTLDGEVKRLWNVLGEDPWEKFDRTVDYRKGINLKPHRAHPNHLFYIGDEPWTTRFEQRDAISLEQPDKRIDIGLERIHDGVMHEGRLYFTTVNGYLAVADPEKCIVEEFIPLSDMHDQDELLGWCRGLAFSGGYAWVGFTRIRPTRFREALSWVRQGFKRSAPTHIACYDLTQRRCLLEVELESHGMNALFTIARALPLPLSATEPTMARVSN